MKIRQGFVSNSSCSSFIVFAKDDKGNDLLTKKQHTALIEFGFIPTNNTLKEINDCAIMDESHVIREENFKNYGHWIVCNQDEVFEFLVQYGISFISLFQYGDDTAIYDANKDKLIKIHDKDFSDKPFEFFENYEGEKFIDFYEYNDKTEKHEQLSCKKMRTLIKLDKI